LVGSTIVAWNTKQETTMFSAHNPAFDLNGLAVWSEEEVSHRQYLKTFLARRVREALRATNPAWEMTEVETPVLMPRALVNPQYTEDDVFFTRADRSLALRPETTAGSYFVSRRMLQKQLARPPFVVWQAGQSFRQEQDHPRKLLRLKAFYQQEFQCVYAADTANDYHEAILPGVAWAIRDATALETRIVPSERLPSYSTRTTDVEVFWNDRWTEMASISSRTDFGASFTVTLRGGKTREIDLLVLEVALGLDRLTAVSLHREAAE
jgi:glycyl-tRNA synthetase